MNRFDTRSIVLMAITAMVVFSVVVPVIGAVIAAINGEPPKNPAFLETVGSIITFSLGMISTYLLQKTDEK